MTTTPRAILTFDDGPIDDKGKDLALKGTLDILEANQITGTFYVQGDEVEKQPALAKLIVDRGHIIQKTQDLIFQVAGVRPNRLRPPFGAGFVGKKSPMLLKVATELGLQLTGWDVDTNDWKAPRGLLAQEKFDPPRKTLKDLSLKRGKPLDFLMHINQDTVKDLKAFIAGLKTEGWQFATYGDAPQKPPVSVA
jgi:peptidoglycan/xylan/chitin deacetylase (PgdA/CDA1 family)